MKVTVIVGTKVRSYSNLNQKGVNSLLTGISKMREIEGFQDQPFYCKVEDEVKVINLSPRDQETFARALISTDFHAGEIH